MSSPLVKRFMVGTHAQRSLVTGSRSSVAPSSIERRVRRVLSTYEYEIRIYSHDDSLGIERFITQLRFSRRLIPSEASLQPFSLLSFLNEQSDPIESSKVSPR